MIKLAVQIAIVIGVGGLVGLGGFVLRRYKFPTTVVSADGFTAKQWGSKTYSVKWADVRRIDAGVEGASYLGIRLFADKVYEIWDTDDGFGDLVGAILSRWPQVKPGWDSLTHAESPFWLTLWEQD